MVDVWSSRKAESPIQLIEKGTQEGSQTGDSWAEKHVNLNAAVLAGTVGCSDSSARNQQVGRPLRDLI